MARAMGDDTQAATYDGWGDLGKTSFESKLWNGSYYQIDTGSTDPSRVMSDQLAGEWYARACGLPPVVPPDHAASALDKIYMNNHLFFSGGTRGVVNVTT